MRKWILLISITFTLPFHAQILFSCQPKEGPEVVESITKRVFDNPDILSNLEEEKITSLIQDLEENVGPQLAVVIIDSLNGEDMDEFALKTAVNMKLGSSKSNDGLLIVVSLKDRLTKIEVGIGLEKIIKDEIASRINREEVGPRFREKKFYEGLYTAVDMIRRLIEDNKQLIGQTP